MNKQTINCIGIGAVLLVSACSTKKPVKPNILFLFTDDQRYNTIGSLGNDDVLTPNIDRLVNSGLTFTHAHIMGGTSGAVSMPSRAMLLTGKSIFHLENKGARIPDDHILMPEYFGENGYNTFGTGKWHNGKKAYARSFDNGGKIMFGGMSDHLKVPLYDFDSSGKYPKEDQYIGSEFSSKMFADEAINFISDYNNESPFFTYVAFTAPHDPRMAPEEFEEMYPRNKIPIPENFLAEHPFNNGEMKIRDEKLAPWPRTHEIVKEHLGAYYAMISHTDFQIGRIIDALKESGQYKNTIIVFAGDNGLAVGSHGLMGKQNVYEHSIRVPLIISGPGLPKNNRTAALVYLNDIFPTLCDLNQLEIPESVEFRSLLPVIKKQDAVFRNEIFYVYRDIHRGIRTIDGWKLIKYNVSQENTIQLYDLTNDPLELNNLYIEGQQNDKFDELENLLATNMLKYDDHMDTRKTNWGKIIVDQVVKKVDHLGVGKEVILGTMYSTKYDGGGAPGLTDGIRGMLDFNDEGWQGYEQVDIRVIVDMGLKTTIKEINAGFLENIGSWIFLPTYIEYAISNDGENFKVVGTHSSPEPKEKEGSNISEYASHLKNLSARYVRIVAKNIKSCPSWHIGSGEKAWVFIDEIIVR